MMFPKPIRTKNKKLMKEYQTMHCLVCNSRFSDPAHVKTQGSGGDDVPQNIMPLCRRHHTEQGQIGIVTFAEKYPKVLNWLNANGWQIENIFGRKRLNRSQ